MISKKFSETKGFVFISYNDFMQNIIIIAYPIKVNKIFFLDLFFFLTIKKEKNVNDNINKSNAILTIPYKL